MTCNCTRDHNGDLLPVGCPEHGDQNENLAGRHRFGSSEYLEPLTAMDWKDVAGVAFVVATIGVLGTLAIVRGWL